MSAANKYKKIKVLGKGGFGAAILVKDRHGHQLVMKEVNMRGVPKAEQELARKEVEFLKRFSHPNIIRYEESFLHNGKLNIVMEYSDGGDLSDYVEKKKRSRRPFTEREALDLFCQICLAIQVMHAENVLHRDLKAQNVFLTKKMMVKVGDFGIARSLESTCAMAKTQIGTPIYLSPELCMNKPYNHKTDIWALGVLLFEMLALKVPFEARDMPSLIRRIVGMAPSALPSRYSSEVRKLVLKLLEKNPSKRPSIDDLVNEPIVQANLKKMLSADNISDDLKNSIREVLSGGVRESAMMAAADVAPTPVKARNAPIARNSPRVSPSPSIRSASPKPTPLKVNNDNGNRARAAVPLHRNRRNRDASPIVQKRPIREKTPIKQHPKRNIMAPSPIIAPKPIVHNNRPHKVVKNVAPNPRIRRNPKPKAVERPPWKPLVEESEVPSFPSSHDNQQSEQERYAKALDEQKRQIDRQQRDQREEQQRQEQQEKQQQQQQQHYEPSPSGMPVRGERERAREKREKELAEARIQYFNERVNAAKRNNPYEPSVPVPSARNNLNNARNAPSGLPSRAQKERERQEEERRLEEARKQYHAEKLQNLQRMKDIGADRGIRSVQQQPQQHGYNQPSGGGLQHSPVKYNDHSPQQPQQQQYYQQEDPAIVAKRQREIAAKVKHDKEQAELKRLEEARRSIYEEKRALRMKHQESIRPANSSSQANLHAHNEAHQQYDIHQNNGHHQQQQQQQQPNSDQSPGKSPAELMAERKRQKQEEQERALAAARKAAFDERKALQAKHASHIRPSSARSNASSDDRQARPERHSDIPPSSSLAGSPIVQQQQQQSLSHSPQIQRQQRREQEEAEKLRLLAEARVQAHAERQELRNRFGNQQRPSSAASMHSTGSAHSHHSGSSASHAQNNRPPLNRASSHDQLPSNGSSMLNESPSAPALTHQTPRERMMERKRLMNEQKLKQLQEARIDNFNQRKVLERQHSDHIRRPPQSPSTIAPNIPKPQPSPSPSVPIAGSPHINSASPSSSSKQPKQVFDPPPPFEATHFPVSEDGTVLPLRHSNQPRPTPSVNVMSSRVENSKWNSPDRISSSKQPVFDSNIEAPVGPGFRLESKRKRGSVLKNENRIPREAKEAKRVSFEPNVPIEKPVNNDPFLVHNQSVEAKSGGDDVDMLGATKVSGSRHAKPRRRQPVANSSNDNKVKGWGSPVNPFESKVKKSDGSESNRDFDKKPPSQASKHRKAAVKKANNVYGSYLKKNVPTDRPAGGIPPKSVEEPAPKEDLKFLELFNDFVVTSVIDEK